MMNTDKHRHRIAVEAARLMHTRRESDVQRAKLQAARTLYRGWLHNDFLPHDLEIRLELDRFARCANPSPIEQTGQWEFAAGAVDDDQLPADRFETYRRLLLPLEQVMQPKREHPEGDALYHSLQVFELARDAMPYDEEFLTAALLHDVGKAIDPEDNIAAALSALDQQITERTAWFIANLEDAHRLLEGTIGARARRRLHQADDYDALLQLARYDLAGRQPGGAAPEVDEALDALRHLARYCD